MRDSCLKRGVLEDEGLVIVEATLVFPIMFFVLFFIIYVGNIYYGISQIDSMVITAGVKGAQSISDPIHYEMETNDTVPMDFKVNPYRYVFGEVLNGSIDQIEDLIQEEVEKDIDEKTISFFNNMKPKVIETKVEFNNYVLYSTFEVEVYYEIPFPITIMGTSVGDQIKYRARTEVAVNDTPEFVRNIDMVVDLLQDTKLGTKIESFFDKINDFIQKFGNSGGD